MPAILTVDDDEPVLRSIERDLRARYGDRYRVMGAGSGHEALELSRELTRRGDVIALFVVDQRMPVMTGIELLREALPLQPDAKRILLTAYADTEVAIDAINEIRLDQYVLKPWDPPEERLYPVLDDLLADWQAELPSAVRGPPPAVRAMGAARPCHPRLPHPQPGAVRLARSGGGRGGASPRGSVDGAVDLATPIVVFPDGRSLRDPSNRQLADELGLSTRGHAAVLRPGDRRCRAGRPGGRRVRGQRGPEDAARRARGAGRAGRHHQPDRELPRLPVRAVRGRSGASRPRPGATAGCGDPHVAGGGIGAAKGRSVPHPRAGRRGRAQLPGGGHRHRRQLPPAERSGSGRAARPRRLLRRRHDRGASSTADFRSG